MIANSTVALLLGLVFVVLIGAVLLIQRSLDPYRTRRTWLRLPSLPMVWIDFGWLHRPGDEGDRPPAEPMISSLSLEERIAAFDAKRAAAQPGQVVQESSRDVSGELTAIASFGDE